MVEAYQRQSIQQANSQARGRQATAEEVASAARGCIRSPRRFTSAGRVIGGR